MITLNVKGVRPVSANEPKVEEQGKKERVKDGGKRKKRELIGIFLNWPQFAHYPPTSRSVKMCGVGGFSNACHVCLSLPATPQKCDWLKCWRKQSNLTNRTVYQNEVLQKMLTGLTFPSLLSPYSLNGFKAGLSQSCARSIYDWLAIERPV